MLMLSVMMLSILSLSSSSVPSSQLVDPLPQEGDHDLLIGFSEPPKHLEEDEEDAVEAEGDEGEDAFEPEYEDEQRDEDDEEDETEEVEPEIVNEEDASDVEYHENEENGEEDENEDTTEPEIISDEDENEDENDDEAENDENDENEDEDEEVVGSTITFVVPLEQEQDEEPEQEQQPEDEDDSMPNMPMMMMAPPMMMMNDQEDLPPAFQMVSEFFDDVFSSVFQRMGESPFEDPESTRVVTRIHISTSPDEMFEQNGEAYDLVQHIRESMAEFTDAAREQSMMMSPNDNDEPVHRYCSIQRDCADDIDRLCAVERTSNIAAAIPHCLNEHVDELNDQCRQALEERFNDGEDQEQQDQPEEQPVAAVPESTPEQNEAPCAEDARQFCSETKQGPMEIVACLHRSKASLSAKCLESVQNKPVFACAEDLISQCADVRGRAKMLRCLYSQASLSDECSAVLGRPLNSNEKTPMPHMTSNMKTASVRDHVVATLQDVSSKIPIVPLAIGFSLFVVLIVAAVIRYRRRRARAAKRVVQLVVPNQDESQVQMI